MTDYYTVCPPECGWSEEKNMTDEKLIQAVLSVSVETGSLVCLGCTHENNCGIHGCAILRESAERLRILTEGHP